MDIGKLGVFLFTDSLTAAQAAELADRIEKWGYGALWFPEAVGRNSVAHASWLLASTRRLVVASGIANIYARDAQAAAAARLTLNEQSGNRYLMGLGVSHAPLVEGLRGHHYGKPIQAMRSYLEKMRQATYRAPAPAGESELVLAALGPRMLELAAELTDGAHPYNVTPEHTAMARKILGPGKRLYVEHKVVLETDPVKAREIGRQGLAFYKDLPNYRNNWLRLGFTEDDCAGPSDRLVDAVVAWGDEARIRARIQEHYQAGADHVCIQPLAAVEETLERLAPAGR